MRISSREDVFGQSIDTASAHFEEDEPFESLEEIEAQTIGNLLPDDDDLFSGVIDGTDFVSKTKNGDDMEDFDLFSSVGGMELEADDSLTCYGSNKTADLAGVISNSQQIGSNGSFAGEHPFGEHPSRTLFVRNINSNVEDAELRALFEVLVLFFHVVICAAFFSIAYSCHDLAFSVSNMGTFVHFILHANIGVLL